MKSQPLSLLTKAQSVIQREAILTKLAENGIEAVTSPRDMSRKVADDTVDLALEGYSVFFDGFAIYVEPEDFSRAAAVLDDVMIAAEKAGYQAHTSDESHHYRRFFFCSLFTFIVPGILHLAGIYHLYRAVKNKEQVPLLQLIVSLVLFISLPVFLIFVWQT